MEAWTSFSSAAKCCVRTKTKRSSLRNLNQLAKREKGRPTMTPRDSEKPTFRIPVSTGIFEHWRDIREAIWLLLWYIDKTTRESEADGGGTVGSVLGGLPIRDRGP